MAHFSYEEPNAQFLPPSDFFDQIAEVAHNCYRVKEKGHSENVLFVHRLIESGHLAMIEHYRFLFEVPEALFHDLERLHDPFLLLESGKGRYVVSLSLRPLLERGSTSDALQALSGALPEEISSLLPFPVRKDGSVRLLPLAEAKTFLAPEAAKEIDFSSYRIRTDRGVTHELVRHRLCSFAQESTRYCNYSKDKFGHELKFLKPCGYDKDPEVYDAFFEEAACAYFLLLEDGALPQEARAVLPNALMSTIIVTASQSEWEHIFALRLAPEAHPDIRRTLLLVAEDQRKRGLLQ